MNRKVRTAIAAVAVVLAAAATAIAPAAPAAALEPCDIPGRIDQVFREYRKYVSPDGRYVETVMYVQLYDGLTLCGEAEIVIGTNDTSADIKKPVAEVGNPPAPTKLDIAKSATK